MTGCLFIVYFELLAMDQIIKRPVPHSITPSKPPVPLFVDGSPTSDASPEQGMSISVLGSSERHLLLLPFNHSFKFFL